MNEVSVPTGKVKWYDVEKGFGFLSREDGDDVFVHSSALPEEVSSLKPGQRVEFGVAAGRRGEQALSLRILDPLPSVSSAARKKPDEMATRLEDVITLLDGLSNSYRRGRRPDNKSATRVASILRAVADELEL